MSGKLRSVQRVFFSFYMNAKPCCCCCCFFFVLLFCFLSEREACDWGRNLYSTVNQSSKPPNESCETGKKRRRQGHFLSVVDVSLMTSSWQGLVDLPHCSWAALVPRIGPLLRSWGAETRQRGLVFSFFGWWRLTDVCSCLQKAVHMQDKAEEEKHVREVKFDL